MRYLDIRQPWLWAALFALGMIAPFVAYPVYLMELLCFALFAAAFNLLLGFGGLLSFGHAAFFGGGAYVGGYVLKTWGVTPEIGILIALVASGAVGLLFGLVAIRRQGIYFAMITLALAQIVFFLCVQSPQTGGEDGLQGIPRGTALGLIDLSQTATIGDRTLPLALYYFVFTVFCAGMWLIYRTVYSPFGQTLKAIRENEARALSLGYRVERYKLLVFVLSAALAGTAGATKALVFRLASLTDVSWQMSGEVVLMTLLGGMGTILGPVLGAATVRTLHHQLSSLGAWVTVIIGAIFVICVIAFRRGIVGELSQKLRKAL